MRRALVNGMLVTPNTVHPGGVLMEDGRISGLLGLGEIPPDCDAQDVGGAYITPGFVDLHTHGGGNADFTDATADSVVQAATMHLYHGTTAMTPTILACAPEQLYASMDAYEQALGKPGLPDLLGIHLEGPYFSVEMKGAQDERYIRAPDPAEYNAILERSRHVARWSLAPELPGGLEMGLALRKRGIVASIAHSNATHEDVALAAEHGFSMITHFYSGMSTIRRERGYRIPGVIESGMLFDDFTVELIADGHHLPDALLQLVYKTKGPSRICLVTDSMRAAGLGDGMSVLGSLEDGTPVRVKNGVALLLDESAFAGSVATTDRLLATAVSAGIPLADAVKMLTLTPAKMAGVDGRIGSLTPGKDADIVVLEPDTLAVRQVWAKGRDVAETGGK